MVKMWHWVLGDLNYSHVLYTVRLEAGPAHVGR